MKRRLSYHAASVAVALTILCMFLTFATNLPGQAAKQNLPTSPEAKGFGGAHELPPGGPTPRTADGHPDLTGRYYPGRAGRMIAPYTPGVGENIFSGSRVYDPRKDKLYDATKTPQEDPVFRPETKAKYQKPTDYGSCAPGGTPTSITTQATENGPFELLQFPGRVYVLTEFPLTVRYIPTDGNPHPADPDVTFNGDSRGHWEGDTLVVDTIAIDTRMRNISVGKFGDSNAWTHSEKEHVIERFSRPSKNYLSYQVSVEDPIVLTKPFHSVPYTFTLAQRPDDVWTEYLCTANEEPEFWKNANAEHKNNYETGKETLGPGSQ